MKKPENLLVEYSVKLTAVGNRVKKIGINIREYFYEEDTVKHITLVLYDLLPLSVKIGMRYQKFHEVVERNIKAIRDGVLGHETEIVVAETKKPAKKLALKKEAVKKQTAIAKTKKTVASKKVAKKTVSAKKVIKNEE